MPRDFERFAGQDSDSVFIAKIKVRYLVEKFLEGSWVLMARFPDGSDPEQRENLCWAMGGKVRVEDVTRHEYVLDKEFE